MGELQLFRQLVGRLTIPTAVVVELAVGRARGYKLPVVEALDWVVIRDAETQVEPDWPADLGAGERAVLLLALEIKGSVAILDDAAARAAAERFSVPIIGTLGILKSAKRAGLIPRVLPYLDRLETLGFRLAKTTRAAVLSDAGEL